jgi:competence protein ComEC
VVIVSVPLTLTGPCEVFDQKRLRATGSLAITDKTILSARDLSGRRIWNTRPARVRRDQ